MNNPIQELKTYPYIAMRFDISEVPVGHALFGEGPHIRLTERGAKPRGRGNTTPPSTALICRDGGKLSMTIRVPFHSALPGISDHDPEASLITISAESVTALFKECRKRGWMDDFSVPSLPLIKFAVGQAIYIAPDTTDHMFDCCACERESAYLVKTSGAWVSQADLHVCECCLLEATGFPTYEALRLSMPEVAREWPE